MLTPGSTNFPDDDLSLLRSDERVDKSNFRFEGANFDGFNRQRSRPIELHPLTPDA